MRDIQVKHAKKKKFSPELGQLVERITGNYNQGHIVMCTKISTDNITFEGTIINEIALYVNNLNQTFNISEYKEFLGIITIKTYSYKHETVDY